MAPRSDDRRSVAESLRQLYRHLSRRRQRQLGLLLLLMVAGALAEVATLGAVLPFLTLIADPALAESFPMLQALFGTFGWERPDDILLPAAALFAAIALGAGALRLLLTWASQKFVYRVGHDIATEVYRRALYQPYKYHISRNTSDLISAITKVQVITWGVMLHLMLAATGVVVSIFILTALIFIDARTALVAGVSFGIIYLAVSFATRERLQANSRIIAAMQTKRVQTIQEGLGGIRDVLLDRGQPVYLEKFSEVDLAYHNAQTVNAFIGAAPRFVIEACGMVLIAGLALMLGRGDGGLVAALPVLGALALGAQRLLPLMQLIYHGWTQASGNRQILDDILGYLQLPVRKPGETNREVPPLPFHRAISLNDVGFRYTPEGPDVLSAVNLHIGKGERIALIGKTGSGKSTMTDIIMGLLAPTSGEIRIDDRLLDEECIASWQAQIAHVPQTIYLSDATIAENIAFGCDPDKIDLGRIREAARQAEIADYIDGLPHDYATMVGERGVRLSGGQRQRIGLARALYREASVLVLDEATSALDTETEGAVMSAIERLGPELTILIVAHRTSTIGFCDRVLRIHLGKALELTGPSPMEGLANLQNKFL